MGLLDRTKNLIGIGSGVSQLDETPSVSRSPSSQFFRGEKGNTLRGWRPALRSSQSDISQAWDQAVARTVDTVQNSGWMAGSIEQSIANVVGTGLRLKPMPETDLIGFDKVAAREWIKIVERRWELWANNPQECDIEGRRNFGEKQQQDYAMFLATGESLSENVWRRRPWNTNGTKFRVLTPTRLSRRSNQQDRLVNGVYLDRDGMAVAYAIKNAEQNRATLDRRVRGMDRYGRPLVVHTFNGAPETCRGITPLAPVLKVLRQFDQLSDATLTAAILQTLFAATITSSENTEEMLEGLMTPQEQAELQNSGTPAIEAYLDMVEGYYEGADFDVGMSGRFAHLFPGEKMEFLTAEHPNGNYADFSKMLLREISRCLGLTYESVTGDYNGASYASLGRAVGEIHEITKTRRQNVVAPASQPYYEAWLEEEIQTGRIPFIGGIDAFTTNRTAACRAAWRGGAKPIAEELKLSKAHETWLRSGVVSEQWVCNELGHDYEDVLAEKAEAIALRAEYDVPAPIFGGVGGSGADSEGTKEKED